MKNAIRTFATVFLLFVTVESARPSNFKDGYIITLAFDTVYGQINNNSYHQNSLACTFRKSPLEASVSYTPDDLFGYRFIDGKYYVSKFVPQYKRTLFLEYLIQGSLNVYFLQEEDNVNRFYVAKDTLPLRLLKYEVKDIYDNGLHFQQLNNMSQTILEYYTQDCPEMIPIIRKMKKPEHEEMIQFAANYHHRVCPNGSCQIFEKKMPQKIYATASIGIGYFPLPFEAKFELFGSRTPGFYFSNALSVLFQQSWVSESTYFGIGYADYERIPVSIMHLPEGNGLRPIFGYEIDLNKLNASQNVIFGLRMPMKKMYLTLTGNLTTTMFVTPTACSARLGLMYPLR